jgi:hypothetical protein
MDCQYTKIVMNGLKHNVNVVHLKQDENVDQQSFPADDIKAAERTN